MAQQDVLDLVALILLVCVAAIFLIDVATELGLKRLGSRFKWTTFWYAARYIAIICGIVLAFDTLI